MLHGIEFWGNINNKNLNKIKKIYNDIIRVCLGRIDQPNFFSIIDFNWMDFNELLCKKTIFWSRIIRSPSSNIIYKRILNKYWDRWIVIRQNEKFNIFNLDSINNNDRDNVTLGLCYKFKSLIENDCVLIQLWLIIGNLLINNFLL